MSINGRCAKACNLMEYFTPPCPLNKADRENEDRERIKTLKK
jgi:hypothetical protein